MGKRVFSIFLATGVLAGTAHAEPLASWLAEHIDEAYVRSTLEDDEFRLTLHEVAEELTAGYRVEDLDDCRLLLLERMLPTVISRRHNENLRPDSGREVRIPDRLQGTEMAERMKEALRRQPPQPNALETFKLAVLRVLYGPGYEPVDAERVRAQIDELIEAMIDGLREQYPGMIDDEAAGELTARWSRQWNSFHDNCLDQNFKVPLPRDDFEALVERVRRNPVDEMRLSVQVISGPDFNRPERAREGGGQAEIDEEQLRRLMEDPSARVRALQRRIQGPGIRDEEERLIRALDSATVGSRMDIRRSYASHARAVLGPVEPEELEERVEAAGLDPRQLRFSSTFGR